MQINPAELQHQDRYKLLIGSIVPRPIAFVSTLGKHGPNLAPFSFFTGVSVDPPMVGFTSMPGPYGPKDTQLNIQETGEFVVNIVSSSFLEKMNITAADSPIGVNEFELAGLQEKESISVKPPRVAESKIHLECKLHKIVELGEGPNAFIIGEVVLFHIDDDIMMDRHRIRWEGLEPVGRMAGNLYTVCDNVISIKRKRYQDL
ncbi:flavin reductase family protein [Bacillus dakarensis]|uniref:flavin reductase family protein n=1 Tax=Robertmurraya dakarensis TaxID=1926278 RepID=UPI0009815303|nr:flavin reductase family protein [Bacillus dakarensis]